ncbi:hypothetical protein B5G12_08205 [Faecalibacterium sp. An58]|uniref:cytidylate kinase-like family protein n=1 Tax=Faecalibacterium sp. An58 TaxID=1965648 RepID=UPI000B3AE822|nr:cytidylate kinase-like family protein [Faecalibacterium sp. An58]OUN72927.1 hypothetical protein B5G12_08205 [Faecalibacterium sp. An58]
MNRIITISREFGSGGREVGKRLADTLGCAYYDSEIEAGLARQMNLDQGYVARAIGNGILTSIPLHFGRTISSPSLYKQQVDILVEKQKLLKELAAASDCVIVGRAADVILSGDDPLKLFVYADMDHKVARCQQYEEAGRLSSPRQLEREIKRVDARRAQYHSMFSDMRWGDKTGYHLCINTTGLEIKQLIPHLAGYAEAWFALRRR